jgi:hypothetical protein
MFKICYPGGFAFPLSCVQLRYRKSLEKDDSGQKEIDAFEELHRLVHPGELRTLWLFF